MTQTITIKNPTSQTTKIEETAILKKLQESINEASYLSSLVSPGLVDWFTEMVHNDFTPDIMATLADAREDIINAERETRSARSLAEAAAIAEAKYHNLYNAQVELVELKNKKIDSLHQEEGKLILSLSAAREDIGNLQSENARLQSEIDRRDAEMIRLKALLWDLTNGSK